MYSGLTIDKHFVKLLELKEHTHCWRDMVGDIIHDLKEICGTPYSLFGFGSVFNGTTTKKSDVDISICPKPTFYCEKKLLLFEMKVRVLYGIDLHLCYIHPTCIFNWPADSPFIMLL